MTNELIRYVLEQSSGVVISLLLITRVEAKLDAVAESMHELAQTIVQHQSE